MASVTPAPVRSRARQQQAPLFYYGGSGMRAIFKAAVQRRASTPCPYVDMLLKGPPGASRGERRRAPSASSSQSFYVGEHIAYHGMKCDSAH